MSSGTPGMTSDLLRIFVPSSMHSATDFPPRAASAISSQMRATDSGWLSFSPFDLLLLASSAAEKRMSLSTSFGVSLVSSFSTPVYAARKDFCLKLSVIIHSLRFFAGTNLSLCHAGGSVPDGVEGGCTRALKRFETIVVG